VTEDVSQYVDLSVCKVYCGKTAEWTQVPFGMVSGVSRGMGLLDGAGYRQRGRGSFGGLNLWHPIVINGDFVTQYCEHSVSCN